MLPSSQILTKVKDMLWTMMIKKMKLWTIDGCMDMEGGMKKVGP